jgi:quercetin dioxygenase-like cupin family protein
VPQPPSRPTAPSVPGIAYVLSGKLLLTDNAGATATPVTGAAAFVGPSTQLSASDTTTSFDYFGVTASSTRSGPGPFPGTQPVYATPDLPSLPVVNQHEALVGWTLQSGGFSPAHRPNGVELIIALEGTIDLGLGGTDVKHLKAGDAVYELEGSFMQLINRGSGKARYLAFFLLPSGTALTRPA